MKNIDQTVKNVLSAVFEVNEETPIELLNINSEESWDSMKQLTLIAALENEFDIFIEATDATNLTSYDNIMNYLINHSEIN